MTAAISRTGVGVLVGAGAPGALVWVGIAVVVAGVALGLLRGAPAARTYGAPMVSRISHTTIDCRDAHALSQWWKDVIGYTDVPGDPNEPGDEECMIVDLRSGHRLLFVEVPDAKSSKNRLHLDLAPTSATRDEEVGRLRGLGAQDVADLRRPDGTGWVVLRDPEGNEFCVLRSDAERAAP
jgi:catechol 2,3-dioxygenase-like lactoylglutathione lyase family enzyme